MFDIAIKNHNPTYQKHVTFEPNEDEDNNNTSFIAC